MRARRPCFREFLAELALPSGVMGPLDLAPLRRAISARVSGRGWFGSCVCVDILDFPDSSGAWGGWRMGRSGAEKPGPND